MDSRIQQLTAQGHLLMSAQRIAQLEVDLMESDRRIVEANQRIKDAEGGGKNRNPYNITAEQVKNAIKTLHYLDRWTMGITTDKFLITNMMTAMKWAGEAGRAKCIKDGFGVSELIALDNLQKYCELY